MVPSLCGGIRLVAMVVGKELRSCFDSCCSEQSLWSRVVFGTVIVRNYHSKTVAKRVYVLSMCLWGITTS